MSDMDYSASRQGHIEVRLIGGPAGLPETARTQRIRPCDRKAKIKIAYCGGYEHFEWCAEPASAEGGCQIFRWTMRTAVAE